MVLGRYIKTAVKTIIKWSLADDAKTKTRDYPEDSPIPVSMSMSIGSGKMQSNSQNININGMNFTVYSATGGKVIEFKTYDPRTDRSVNSLYVITDKEDLGEELGQIITKESLFR